MPRGNLILHRAEAGLEAESPPFNLNFSKADSSLCGACSKIIRPSNI